MRTRLLVGKKAIKLLELHELRRRVAARETGAALVVEPLGEQIADLKHDEKGCMMKQMAQ